MYKKIVCVLALFIAICDSTFNYTAKRHLEFADCERLVASDLGTSDRLSTTGLLPNSFQFQDDSGPAPQLIRILSYQIVCETFGLRRGTISSTSVIATTECEGSRCIDGGHQYVRVNRTDHFHYDCYIGGDGVSTFSPPFRILEHNRLRTPTTMINLQISADTRCGACIPPREGRDYATADEYTHCLDCHPQCNEGLRACTGPYIHQCCNWYINDTCVTNCPPSLREDIITYECVCDELLLRGGRVDYTHGQLVGSVATHRCNNDVCAVNGSTNIRTCGDTGWTNTDLVCECCPELRLNNGTISYSDELLLGSLATYSCSDPQCVVQGQSSTRTCTVSGWTGSDITCACGGVETTQQSLTQQQQGGGLSDALINAIVAIAAIVSVLIFILGFVSGAIIVYLRVKRSKPKEEVERYRALSAAKQAYEENITPQYIDNATPLYNY